MDLTQNAEELRRSLLEEIYAGAASGLGAMLMDEEKIRQARSRKSLQTLHASMGSNEDETGGIMMQTSSDLKALLALHRPERLSGL